MEFFFSSKVNFLSFIEKIKLFRLLQNKLKTLENTICWVNEEEALFKFPQTSYQDVGDINTISTGKKNRGSDPSNYNKKFVCFIAQFWQLVFNSISKLLIHFLFDI